jgi:hypothetical protein
MTSNLANSEQNQDDTPRQPISAAMLSQAAEIAPDTCFGYDDEQHRMGSAMPSEHGQAIVTWRGIDYIEKVTLEVEKITIVNLSKSDIENARRIATIRNSKNGRVPNYRVTKKHSDFDIHFVGAKSEIAIANLFNLKADDSFLIGGDNGEADLVIDGFRVQIKGAMYKPPILKLNHLSDFKLDIAIICFSTIESNTVEVYGSITKKDFFAKHYERDFGYGVRYCIDDSQLTPISTWRGPDAAGLEQD